MADPKALAFKEKGNVAFKAGDFPSAIGHYTSAILADRNDVTFPLNRAAAYLKLGKYEDTERDCNTVLALSSPKSNVKALFRRGQARVGMGKLLEAQKGAHSPPDLPPTLSTNLAILHSQTSPTFSCRSPRTLLPQRSSKRCLPSSRKKRQRQSKSKSTPVSIPSIPSPSTTNDAPVKRRRVPIRIVGDTADSKSGSTSASTSSTAIPPAPTPTSSKITPASAESAAQPLDSSSTAKGAPSGVIDTLQAVSSRSLKSTAPPPSSSSGPAPPLSSTTPVGTTPAPTAHPLKPDSSSSSFSFKDAKQVRDSKSKNAHANAKAPRVGGGIFRASGASTIFAARGSGAASGVADDGRGEGEDEAGVARDSENAMEIDTTPAQPAPVPVPAQTAAPVGTPAPAPAPPARSAPSTLFEFSKAWYGIKDPWERWAFINTIAPAQLPALCKTSLEPPLLASILAVFRTVLASPPAPSSGNVAPSIKLKVQAYMEHLARIPRFGTLVLFLSGPERAVAREVWRGVGVERPGGVWAPVA
ncbi:hypothetical protein CVT25_005629 [Psilocybe cyanescens]|uniref:RNA polymerase II-associated protein 3 n=1 Tax=Psilocybe cyanescens TaxID=93625 RepID=A0A409X6A3_PSICY|nr:hypothetical protein CVT25_005629 [Psilocybe cyanescens]